MSYRNSLQIMGDVLLQTSQYGQDGANKSILMRKSNLSHSRLNQFLNNLIGSGLINDIVYENHQTFVITPKGIQFLDKYRAFQELAGSFGLDMQVIAMRMRYNNPEKRFWHSLLFRRITAGLIFLACFQATYIFFGPVVASVHAVIAIILGVAVFFIHKRLRPEQNYLGSRVQISLLSFDVLQCNKKS